ncbi:MAG: hypothetical protein DHS20C02_02560 [Micavibrio sp.]|nr:MAG: hypothetical protein DHS20C02_02560 [Micavibrio sp.]
MADNLTEFDLGDGEEIAADDILPVISEEPPIPEEEITDKDNGQKLTGHAAKTHNQNASGAFEKEQVIKDKNRARGDISLTEKTGRIERGAATTVSLRGVKEKEERFRKLLNAALRALQKELAEVRAQISRLEGEIKELEKDISETEKGLEEKYGPDWKQKLKKGELDVNDPLVVQYLLQQQTLADKNKELEVWKAKESDLETLERDTNGMKAEFDAVQNEKDPVKKQERMNNFVQNKDSKTLNKFIYKVKSQEKKNEIREGKGYSEKHTQKLAALDQANEITPAIREFDADFSSDLGAGLDALALTEPTISYAETHGTTPIDPGINLQECFCVASNPDQPKPQEPPGPILNENIIKHDIPSSVA